MCPAPGQILVGLSHGVSPFIFLMMDLGVGMHPSSNQGDLGQCAMSEKSRKRFFSSKKEVNKEKVPSCLFTVMSGCEAQNS